MCLHISVPKFRYFFYRKINLINRYAHRSPSQFSYWNYCCWTFLFLIGTHTFIFSFHRSTKNEMNTITVLILAMFVFSQWSTTAAASTYPTEKPKAPAIAQLLRNDYVSDNNGQFSLNYQVDDGTSQTREGTLVLNDEGDDYVLIQKGSYSYISPEGIKVTVTYTADKEGFKIVESSNDVPARA